MTLIKRKPPAIGDRLLRILLSVENYQEKSGDIEEVYYSLIESYGLFKAKIWYWSQVIKAVTVFFLNNLFWSFIMLKNYLKVAFRNLRRERGYSFINISGLAVGMMCTIFISLYIMDELSYDRFHKNADNIYRIGREGMVLQGPLAPLLKSEVPEIEDYVRIYAPHIWGSTAMVSTKEKQYYSDRFLFADPAIFSIFTFPFIKGNPKTVLENLHSIVITEEMALKYFGSENPVGKTLIYENKYNYTVTGVVKTIPSNSHFRFDFVIPIENYRKFDPDFESWGNSAFFTYLLLRNNVSKVLVEKKITNSVNKHMAVQYKNPDLVKETFLTPLKTIHLYSNGRYEMETNGNILYIYIFASIAVLILIVACINFVNLSTARSMKRVKEIGVRKVIGAKKNQLVRQFLGESVLMSLFAFTAALFLVYIFLPEFNRISGKQIFFSFTARFSYIIILFIFAVFTGIAAGLIPAFHFSSLKPVSVLNKKYNSGIKGKISFRSLLVGAQSVISICLIASTIIINNQIDFIRNKNLGYNKEQVLIVPTHRSENTINKSPVLKKAFLNIPGVINTSIISQIPGERPWTRSFKNTGQQGPFIGTIWADTDFIKTYKMKIVAGREFSGKTGSDMGRSTIINETAVGFLGFSSVEKALGSPLNTDSRTWNIIGVIKDFHFNSLHKKISPVVIHASDKKPFNLSLKINTGNVPRLINSLKDEWEKILPDRPFDYYFLDSRFDRLYQADQRIGTFIIYFTCLAIVIVSLGLFGLAALITGQRTKEIGVRKVLGAPVTNIVYLVLRYFLMINVLSIIISAPIIYYMMNKWLQNFAYKINPDILTFVYSGIFALAVTVLAVGQQAIKAARSNPVDALKHE